MITYILQYEIPFKMQFSNLGHDLLFLSYDLIDISYHMHLQLMYESSMSSNKPFEFMTYLFDLPNALNS